MPRKPLTVKRMRASMKLSQSELARALGVRALQVSRWERGETPPAEPTLRLLRVLYALRCLGESAVHSEVAALLAGEGER